MGVVQCGVLWWCGVLRCGVPRRCYRKAMAGMVLNAGKCKPGGLCVVCYTCGRGPSPCLVLGIFHPGLPWGPPEALLDGATKGFAGPCPRCLRALVGH